MLFNGLGEGGLNRLLSRRLNIPGNPPAPSVEPALFAGLTLENDRPEWSFLKGEALFGAYVSVALVAAQYPMVQLYLPTTARSIAVITLLQNASTQQLAVARLVGISGSLAGWTARNTLNRDTRANAVGGACRLEINNNVAQPTNHGTLHYFQSLQNALISPLVLAPGGAIAIYGSTLGTPLEINIGWYERPAEISELV